MPTAFAIIEAVQWIASTGGSVGEHDHTLGYMQPGGGYAQVASYRAEAVITRACMLKPSCSATRRSSTFQSAAWYHGCAMPSALDGTSRRARHAYPQHHDPARAPPDDSGSFDFKWWNFQFTYARLARDESTGNPSRIQMFGLIH